MRATVRNIAILIVSAGFLSGCAFFRGHFGEEFDPQAVAEIKKGTTTRTDVTARFGAPDEIVHAADRDIFHYRRYDSKMGFLVIISRFNIKGDHLYVFFNHDGVVDDVVYGKRTDRLQFQVWPFGD
jgi:outer membrane protein assembly factor BamE (lipoprotein component of BamABCDE complex)